MKKYYEDADRSERAPRRNSTHVKVALLSIALILVLMLSFTLAWFSGAFTNQNNVIESGHSGNNFDLSLYKQEKLMKADDSLNGWQIPIKLADQSDTEGAASQELWRNSKGEYYNSTTNDFDSTLTSTDANAKKIAAKFLSKEGNEQGWLPNTTVTKRIYLENKITRPVDFSLAFALDNYNLKNASLTPDSHSVDLEILAEAMEFTIYRIDTTATITPPVASFPDGAATKLPDVTDATAVDAMTLGNVEATPLEGFDGVGMEELRSRHLSDVCPAAEFAPDGTTVTKAGRSAYEIQIRFADTASILYSKNLVDMDVTIDSFAEVGRTHFVYTAEELTDLLAAGSDAKREDRLEDYDFIVLKGDITVDNFQTDRLFNLQLGGYDLVVKKNFQINVGSKWGTIDLGTYNNSREIKQADGTMATNNGFLFLPYNGYTGNANDTITNAVTINTPRVAIRYGAVSQLDANGKRVNAAGQDIDAATPPGDLVPKSVDLNTIAPNYITTRALNGAQDIKSSALPEVGTMVQFAGKKWIVADIDGEGNYTLIWQDELLPGMYFNENTNMSDWSKSSLRTWLNGDFFTTTLASSADIIPVKNAGMQYLLANGDTAIHESSTDYVWIPSESQLFGCSSTDKIGNSLTDFGVDYWNVMVDGRGGKQLSFFVDNSLDEIYGKLIKTSGVHHIWLRSPVSVKETDIMFFYSRNEPLPAAQTPVAGAHAAISAATVIPCVKVKPAAVTAIS